MALQREELERLLLQTAGRRRFTQDSPVFADVWFAYLGAPAERRVDLLLEPHFRVPAAQLASDVRTGLGELLVEHELAYAGQYVAAKLTLRELLVAVVPLSRWWRDLIRPDTGSVFAHLEKVATGRRRLDPDPPGPPQEVPPPRDELEWWLNVAGRLLTDTSDEQAASAQLDEPRTLTRRVLEALGHPTDAPEALPPLWAVSRNRRATATLWRSRETVKADAASRVFTMDTEGLAWAVIDSGIDATHPAFRVRDADEALGVLAPGDFGDRTTVLRTYDFTQLRGQIARALTAAPADVTHASAAIQDSLRDGLAIDWSLYEPFVAIAHTEPGYRPPVHPHGTHVAGTLAGDWRPSDPEGPRHELKGMCPGLTLYDLRVLGDDGEGDEFAILAALSFVRWRNAQSGGTVIHGVNLSFALEHDVRNSACGRSPVCLEAERVNGTGVVVVAAAGNEGRADFTYQGGPPTEGYRTVSITDPGNADVVITVGSTHRIEPHAYGVSYFSSRGPTGDGRAKPDLVAPGEKITAPVPGNASARMDGTSMAAPHVSGAAAMLMARHRELIGRPAEIKRILCDSATDLGRERHYQGHGMVDILRALSSL